MKLIPSLLTAALLTVSLTSFAGADSVEYDRRYITKAPSAPAIDGILTGDEWDGALTLTLTADNTELLMGTTEVFPQTEIRWMWDAEGLYFYGKVNDATAPGVVHTAGTGSYNSGDGLQFCIYPDVTLNGEVPGNMYFVSMAINDEGTVSVGDHFTYGGVGYGADIPGVVSACTVEDGSYVMEVAFPRDCFTKSTTPIPMEEGTTFAMTHVIMESCGTKQALLIDSAWFYGSAANHYTLVEVMPAETDAAETDAPEIAETGADAGEAHAPSGGSSVTGGIIAAAAGVIAVVGVVFANKKRT